MVRLSGAALGLLAFGITILLGLLAGNPVDVTLMRAVRATFAFCLIGMAVGWVASRVLDEHALRRNAELFHGEEESQGADGPGSSPAAGNASGAAGTTAPGS